MTRLSIVLFCCALFAGTGAFAGTTHDHAGHGHAARHGGIVHEVGDVAGELVVKADTLTLHLYDHDKPLATAGLKAEATVHAGGAKTVVALAPAGDNRLAAQGSFKTGVGVRVAVVVGLPGKEAKLNFRLK